MNISDERIGYCNWSNSSNIYKDYHDTEWGIPEFNDKKLFEMLILEGFQAGLSWVTILNKRNNFRLAFDNFNPKTISKYNNKKISQLMNNNGIIRNRLKILSTINSANIVEKKFKKNQSFSDFFWEHINFQPLDNSRKKLGEIPTQTDISITISKKLKNLGFKFCGPVIIYSFMQATGMVNDHLTSCPHYLKCKKINIK
ncbi:MAG: DNA-3-methyladenine glycosylase I [Pseudomonadota bacterium]|nr:DNA-3-methyladenine glycosylase I [Pseudomonadota bacterium]